MTDDYWPDPYELERKYEKKQLERHLEACELFGGEFDAECEAECPQYQRCKKKW